MDSSNKMTVEQYAAKHRISIYQAIRKANSGEVRSETEEVDGKKVMYLFPEDKPAEPPKAEASSATDDVDYKAAYEKLQKEMEAMKKQIK